VAQADLTRSKRTASAVLVLLLLALVVAGCGQGSGRTSATSTNMADAAHRTAASGGHCAFVGSGISEAPDRGCTPGMWISDRAILKTPAASEYDSNVSDGHVCAHGYNPRPGTNISGPLKDQALKEYGLPKSAGAGREADHLYPRWLGGATTLANFWPEPNYAHPSGFNNNPKDELEYKLYQLTCQRHSLTVAKARSVFKGDWRAAYEKYVGSPVPTDFDVSPM
jgi:hypothetical protein